MPIYTDIIQAFRAHWTAHDNKYPKQLTLTPAQTTEFEHLRVTGGVGIAGHQKPDRNKFWGTPIVEDPATTGVLVGVGGVEIPLQAPPATT